MRKNEGGFTALHAAAKENAHESIGVLLSHGADVDGKDEDGVTALHFAVRRNASKVVEILLSHGAGCQC